MRRLELATVAELACVCLGLLVALPVQGQTEPVERVSQVLKSGDEAWAEEGFRLALRVGWESVAAIPGVPSGTGWLFVLHPQVRLSQHWSVAAHLQYTLLNAEGYTGVRFSTALAAGWHPWRSLALEVGAGYAGQVANSCDGVGATSQARLGYLLATGELFATGPVLQAEAFGTRCSGSWWWQRSLQASWAFAWR